MDKELKRVKHLVRGASAVAYGAYYKYLRHPAKRNFKDLYIDCIWGLIDSGLNWQKMLAFYFISNTIKNPEARLDFEFIPLLKTIYEDG